MEKEFVIYSLALRMKKLGYNERCIMHWWKGKLSYYQMGDFSPTHTSAPTFSQAFRWFREKYALDSYIRPNVVIDVPKTYQFNIDDNTDDIWYGTYEEAELACLEKLIKIVEQTNAEMTDHGVYK